MPGKARTPQPDPPRYFTPAQASALVPFLTRAMSRLRELYHEARQAHREKELCEAVGEGPDGRLIMAVDYEQACRRFDEAVAEMRQIIEEVHGLGCQIKHIETGLVDFPARIHGQDVWLCWKLGEPAVQFYHGLEDGYAGRRPIPPDAFDEELPQG